MNAAMNATAEHTDTPATAPAGTVYRTIINADRRTNPDTIHKQTMALFPRVDGNTARAERHILWAENRRGGYILVQSAVEPTQPTGIVGTYSTVLPEGHETWFRVVVNPTVNRTGGTRENLWNPHDVGTSTERVADWFNETATRLGFRIAPTTLNIDGRNTKIRDFRLARVTIEGALQVTDSEQFSRTLTEGFGRGRAFGCGLLLVV